MLHGVQSQLLPIAKHIDKIHELETAWSVLEAAQEGEAGTPGQYTDGGAVSFNGSAVFNSISLLFALLLLHCLIRYTCFKASSVRAGF